MNFNDTFYLIQSIKKLLLQHVIRLNIMVIYFAFFLFHTKPLKFSMHPVYSTPQFRLAAIQVLNSHFDKWYWSN